MKYQKMMVSYFCVAVLHLSVNAFSAPVPDTGMTKCYSALNEITCPSPGQRIRVSDTSSALMIAAGDVDKDGKDDLIGVWSNGVWVRYGATGKWQQISSSKPKWITTGRMTEAIQSAGSLDDPRATGEEVIDLSKEGPDGVDAKIADSVQQ